MFQRIIMEDKVQGRVQFKCSICLELLQIGPYVLGLRTPIESTPNFRVALH